MISTDTMRNLFLIDRDMPSVEKELFITASFEAKRKPMSCPTPVELAIMMCSKHVFQKGDKAIDPCCGRGGISKVLAEYNEDGVTRENDINKEFDISASDFLKWPNEEEIYDHIIFNPPFDLAADFLHKAIKILKQNGQLTCLYPRYYLARLTTYADLFLLLFSCKKLEITDSKFDCNYGAKTCIIHLIK